MNVFERQIVHPIRWDSPEEGKNPIVPSVYRRTAPGGMNFDWNYYEGMHPYKEQPPSNASFTWPISEYSHTNGCAVTGGYFHRGAALPEWQGFFSMAIINPETFGACSI